ncbi:MAG: glycosyltransferase family 39 protein [Flavobacteriales bacterium]|nr:glycosyltransferase family 39 protein [Flavobacteriales bacterium]
MSTLRRSLTDPLCWVLLVPALIKLFFLAPVDLFEAHTIAVEWLRSGEFRYHHLGVWNPNYQFPVYPAIVAGFLLAGLGVYGVLVFQVLCGTVSAWLVYRLALEVNGEGETSQRIALAVALLTGLSPFIAVYQVRMVHPFAWDMLLALALITGGFVIRPARSWQLIGFFALAGIALLNRSTAVLFLLPFLWMQRSFLPRMDHLPMKAIALTVLFLPTSLWVLRNRAELGTWSLNSAMGQNLWLGVQEATEGTAQLADGRNYTALLTVAELVELQQRSPLEQSVFFTQRWRGSIGADPSLWGRMMGVKLRNFWLFRAQLGMHHQGVAQWATALFKGYAVGLFALLLIGAWFGNAAVRLLLSTLLLYSVAQALFYVETRHRLVVEPVLLLIAVSGVVAVWQRYRRFGS